MMHSFFRPSRVVLISLFVSAVSVVAIYVHSRAALSNAIQARRNHDYVVAEQLLDACWSLPGFKSQIVLESQLLAVQQGDLRDERMLRLRIKEGKPDGQLIVEALAKGLLATFRWEEAATLAESMLEQQPSNASAYWLRGMAREQMQQVLLARLDFEKALALEPSAYEIRRSLAGLLHQQGYVRPAMEHYQSMLLERPDDSKVMLALARCLQDDACLVDAERIIAAVLANQPELVEGLVERSRVALRQQDFEAAEKSLRQAVAISPDHIDANRLLRLVLQAQDRVDPTLENHIKESERHQAKLRERQSQSKLNFECLSDIGHWMLRTGQEEEAAGWFYMALKENADHAPAHLGLMEYFGKRGQSIRSQMHARLGGKDLQSPARISAHDESKQIYSIAKDSLSTTKAMAVTEAASDSVQRLCGACHAFPDPASMPRAVWRKEVKQGFDFLRDSAWSGDYPSLESVVAYYEKRAPEHFETIRQKSNQGSPPVIFTQRGTGWIPNAPTQPGISNANLAGLLGSSKKELILCDSRLDALLLLKPYETKPGGIVIPEVKSPCHTTICDLDRDGNQDILVASIGSFFPTDDKVGKVLWLRGKSPGQFDPITLLDGVGRVTDIQVADFDRDGQFELIVAVFGWRTGGEILLLENSTSDWSKPNCTSRVIDSRHGAIHVHIADLNKDDRPDFVSLISQEYETVTAYINEGQGNFQQEIVFAADHPTYGCSGIEMVDLDQDLDLDILLTNGDILDPPYLLKPYHGVRWLENEGRFPFQSHLLATMYGASRAVASDFDGDGDQDVVAVSFLPPLQFPEREKLQLPSVVFFEQIEQKRFESYVLETGKCDHYSCTAGDWDNDGRMDLAIANFAWSGSQPIKDAATLWYNAGTR
jgi:tetratricopeptide (TPR) repeat protein